MQTDHALQCKELKQHIRKQNAEIKQLEIAARQAQDAASQAERQHQLQLEQLQSQFALAQQQSKTATQSVPGIGPALAKSQAEADLRAELQTLNEQLAEAERQIVTLQRAESSSANPSQDLPGSNPTTPSKPVPTSGSQDSATQDSAARDSAKDKDSQLQEYKHRLIKAKKYIQNLKQQAADANSAKEQALADLQALQRQLEQFQEAAGSDHQAASTDAFVPKTEHAELQVSKLIGRVSNEGCHEAPMHIK